MVPWNTVRAQYAKHNPPSHEKKAVDLRVEQLYEDSGFYSPPATETTAHKKGCDTLLRNILLWSERRNRWVIYLSLFFFHLWLWIIKDSFWEKKYEINFAASKHCVNEHVNECFIFQEEEAGNKKAFFEMLLLTPIMQYFRMTEAALQVD